MTDIIILTYGNEELTRRCLQSLKKYTSNYRLIWIDNGSGKEFLEYIFPYASACQGLITQWLPKNIGFVKGTNMALKMLKNRGDMSDYVCLLNNDVEVTPGWLDRMIGVMERNHKVYAVGPITSECSSWQAFTNAKAVIPHFTEPKGFVEASINDRAVLLQNEYGGLSNPCRMLAFFCTVFRSSVFYRVGLLDEDFGIGYGDDDDFCARMTKQKLQLNVSLGTYVFHNHQSTFRKMFSDLEIAKMKKEKLEIYKSKHGEEAGITYVEEK